MTFFGGSGLTVYAIAWDGSGKAWNGSTFVDYVDGDRATYAMALTEVTGTGTYHGAGPDYVGDYSLAYYRQAGEAPALSDITVGAESVGLGVAVLDTMAAQVGELYDGKGDVGSVG